MIAVIRVQLQVRPQCFPARSMQMVGGVAVLASKGSATVLSYPVCEMRGDDGIEWPFVSRQEGKNVE
jgi:hypothetical protein